MFDFWGTLHWNMDLLSVKETINPLWSFPTIVSASQSPMRLILSTILGLFSIETLLGIVPRLSLPEPYFFRFFFFPLPYYVLSYRNLIHTRICIPSIENCQWSKYTRLYWKKTIGQIGWCFWIFVLPTNFFDFDLKSWKNAKSNINLWIYSCCFLIWILSIFTSLRVFSNCVNVGRSDGSYFQHWSIIS